MCLVIDFINAFNTMERRLILEEIWKREDMRDVYCFIHAVFLYCGDIVEGHTYWMELLEFCSIQGVKQGNKESMFLFILGLDPIIRPTDEELNNDCGGGAKAGADDLVLYGTPTAVITQYEAMIQRIQTLGANLEIQISKCQVFLGRMLL